MLTTAPFVYAFGIVLPSMSADLGISIQTISGIYTAYALASALAAPFVGRLIHKIGPKAVILAGCTILTAASFLMTFRVSEIWLYGFTWILMFSVGIRCGSIMAGQVNLSRWFKRKRGLAISIVLSAGGVGGFLFTPLMRYINEAYSWKAVWFFVGGCDLLAFLLVLILLRDNPHTMRQLSDGDTVIRSATETASLPSASCNTGWNLQGALHQPMFYTLIFTMYSATYQMFLVSNFSISHLEQNGISSAGAAAAVSVFSIINITGRLSVGFFSKWVHPQKQVVLGSLLAMAGNFINAGNNGLWPVVTAHALCGIGYGILIVAPQVLLANIADPACYPEINGVFSLVSGILSSLPTAMIGALYHISGSYIPAWYAGAGIMVGTFLINVMAQRIYR